MAGTALPPGPAPSPAGRSPVPWSSPTSSALSFHSACMNAALRSLGLTAPQAEALSVLAQAGPLSLNELGGLLIAEGGHPSRLVDRLVSAGWVAREEAAHDRRRVTLRLTPAGEQMHAQAAQRAATTYASFAERLEGADVTTACAVLAALLHGSDLADVVNRRLDAIDDTAKAPARERRHAE